MIVKIVAFFSTVGVLLRLLFPDLFAVLAVHALVHLEVDLVEDDAVGRHPVALVDLDNVTSNKLADGH